MKKLLASLLSVTLSVSSAQAVPQVLNFQGRLSESGAPSNGSRQITFRIHASPTGGTELFTETRTIAVSSGIFNALIGEETPGGIPLSVFDGNDRYVEVQVGATTLPRQKMASVAHAFVAERAKSLMNGATFQVHTIEVSSMTATTLRVLEALKIGTGTITMDPVANSISFAGQGGIGGLIQTGGGGAPGPLRLETGGSNTIFLSPGGAGLVSMTSSLEFTGAQAKTLSATAAPLTLASGGINPLRFNPAVGSGNVGIGLAAPLLPADKLHLIGQFRVDNDPAVGNSGCLRYNGAQLEFSNDCVAFQSFGGGGIAGSGTPDRLAKFVTATTMGDSVLAEAAGNIGIGTTIPDSKLHVVSAAPGALKIVDTTQGAGKVLTSDASGIATWQPTTPVSGIVDAQIAAGAGIDQSKIANLTSDLASKVAKAGDTMTGTLTLSPASGPAFATTAGNVGIGTTAPDNKLHVVSAAPGALKIADTTQGAGKVLTSDANGVATWQPAGPVSGIVDAQIAAGANIDQSKIANLTADLASKVAKVGDTMTGTLTLSPVSGNAFVTTAGKVGVGTTNPIDILDANGNMSFSATAFAANTSFTADRSITYYDNNGVTPSARILFEQDTTPSHGNEPGEISFHTKPHDVDGGGDITERMRINRGGNVGIGTTIPDSKLHVVSAAPGALKLVDTTQGAGKVLTSDASGVATWQPTTPVSGIVNSQIAAGADIDQSKIANLTSDLATLTSNMASKVSKVGDTMTGTLTLSPASGNAFVTTAGKVGVGTTNPIDILDANGNMSLSATAPGFNTSFTSDRSITYYDNNGVTPSARILFEQDTTPSHGNEPGEISFHTKPHDVDGGGDITERMRINRGGNVGIGTTIPDSKLHVVSAAPGALKIVDTTQGAGKVLTSDASGVATWQPTTPVSGIVNSQIAAGANIDQSKIANLTSDLATLNSNVATLNSNVASKVSKAGDTMTGTLTLSPTLGNNAFVTTAGKVGVGTTNPIDLLDTNGNMSLSATVPSPGTLFSADRSITYYDNNGVTPSARILFEQDTTPSHGNEPGEISFHTKPHDVDGGGPIAERMRINRAGNVGIGTTAPDNKLHVVSAAPGALKIADTTQGAGKVLTSDASGVATWQPTTPVSGIVNSQIAAGANIDQSKIANLTSDLAALNSNVATLTSNVGSKVSKAGDTMTGTLTLSPTSGDAFVTTAGNVGIGTATPDKKLHVVSAAPGALKINDTTQGAGKILTSDVDGVATWQPAAPVSGIVNNQIAAGADIAQSKIANLTSDLATLTSNMDSKVSKAGDTMTGTLTLSPTSGPAFTTTAGNVGIGTNNPQASLEVNGNAIAATPIANNHLATKGYVDAQVSAAGGSFNNFTAFDTPGQQTFTVPAGVTKILAEVWGGGGSGGIDVSGGVTLGTRGGGGGGYGKKLLIVTPGSNLAITVGQGGPILFGAGDGGTSLVQDVANNILISATGGKKGEAGGSGGSSDALFKVDGERGGRPQRIHCLNSGSSAAVEYGEGGGSYLNPHGGGEGGRDCPAQDGLDGTPPGGGGGGGRSLTTGQTPRPGAGAPGLVALWY